jgi:hypothetical protein
VNTIMNLLVPQNAGKFLSSRTIGGFSRKAQLHRVIYIYIYIWEPSEGRYTRSPDKAAHYHIVGI